MVDYVVACQEGRDNQGRDARPGAPFIVNTGRSTLTWWRHMVPLPAKLVVGHDNHGIFRAAAALDCLQQCHEMFASASLARVTRVLVLRRDRLDKADRIEFANIAGRVRKLDEFLLVAEVRS